MSTVKNKPDAALCDYDSDFWRRRIARTERPDVDAWAHKNKVDLVCALIDSADIDLIHQAEHLGYRMVDVRVTLERRTHRIAASKVRDVHERDHASISALASRAHRITRFYADGGFEHNACDAYYETWMRNSINGWADKVLTTDTEMPGGYVTVHLDGTDSSIGLIAVNERYRGKGHGVALALGALNWAAEHGAQRMTVTTQARNIAALRVFERAGFRICETGVWLHQWVG